MTTTMFKISLVLASFFAMPLTSWAQAGSLDLSFDTDGKVITAFGTANEIAHSVAIQSDGKIVAAGWRVNGSTSDFAVARYNTNGSLDNTFDSDGKVTTAIGPANDNAYAVAIQSDGKILAAGWSVNGANADFAIVRYNTNGSLDNTFDSDGKVTTPIGSSNDEGAAIAIQADGKILVAGNSNNGSYDVFTVVRYNTNGSLDNTFDLDGKVTTAIGSGPNRAFSIAIQSDGKIVLAGESNNVSSYLFALARYNPNGSLDNTFDTDGIVTAAILTYNNHANAVAIQNDGKIVVAGFTSNSVSADYDIALLRFNPNGSLDTAFDTDGKVTTSLGTSLDYGNSVAIQSDGKIVVGGMAWGIEKDFALVRYNTNGSLDNTFDTDGIVTTPIGNPDDEVTSIALQTDGKIVVVGYSSVGSNLDFAIARYNNDASVGLNTVKNQSTELVIYPNPFSSSAICQTDKVLNNANLTVYNMYGQMVKQLNNLSGHTVKLERGNLISGIYFIQLSQDNAIISKQKLVIMD